MDNPSTSSHLSLKRKLGFYLLVYFVLFILFLVSAEIIVRLKGIKPYNIPDYNTVVEPDGRLYTNNSTLGYSHMSGTFKIIIAHKQVYYRTHLANSQRLTHPMETYNSNQHKPEVWMFGCSFTYGWLFMDDSATYPWRVQEQLPKYEIMNFGVSGYGTIQSIIQLKEALAQGKKPVLAILDYASFHDERNVCCRTWLRGTVTFNQLGLLSLPYAWLDKDNKVHYKLIPAVYHNVFPFVTHSAFMNFLEIQYDRMVDSKNRGHDVSKALILEFSDICKSHGIPFVLAGMTPTPQTADTLQYCHEHGIQTADISIDFSKQENIIVHDGHPSAAGNQKYANKLITYLLTNKLVGK